MVVRQRGSIRPKSQKWPYFVATGFAALLLGLIVLSLSFPLLTYKGVPLTIILRFIQDPIARQAYFDGDKVGLHHRLDEMDVEAEIKAFYRPSLKMSRSWIATFTSCYLMTRAMSEMTIS